MMNNVIFILLFSLATILPGNADDILSKKVPWSGQTNRATLGELIARASGWAEGANHGELKLTKRLALQDRNKELDKFNFRDDKKSTYGDFLKEAFGMAGLNVVLESTKGGINVTYLLTRRWSISLGTEGKWKQKGLLDSDRLKKYMTERGWRYSKHFKFSIIPGSGVLVARGTEADMLTIGRFIQRSR